LPQGSLQTQFFPQDLGGAGWNLPFQILDAELAGDLMCTLTMDRLVDPGRPHDLKTAYSREFHERMPSFPETFYPKDKKGKPRKPPHKELYEIEMGAYAADPEKVINYATMDAWAVLRLFHRLREQLEQIRTWDGHTLFDVFLWCEVPFTRVLFNMERRGTLIDVDYLKGMRPKIVEEIITIEKKLNKLAGTVVNPNSNPQLASLLFDKLGLEPLKFTRDASALSVQMPERARAKVWQPAWRSTKREEGEDSSIQLMHVQPLVEVEPRHHAGNAPSHPSRLADAHKPSQR
jgi:hypothetical protein